MQKNIAGQKFIVFAFNKTNNNPVTGDAANITANIRKDYGSSLATNDINPTEQEDGFYAFDATQAETNADVIQIFPESVTANVQVILVGGIIYTTPVSFADDIIQTADHTSALTTIDSNVDTSLTNQTTINNNILTVDGIVDAILLDTNELQTNQGDWLTATGFSTFNPATDTVATVTTVTNMRGTDNALLAASYTAPDNTTIASINTKIDDIPTTAEFNARTLLSAEYSQFNATTDEVNANTVKINGVTVLGAGTAGDLWRA